ncbi:MAG: hypothetical protein R3E87_18505 [Burkholderiaceae bacterium]
MQSVLVLLGRYARWALPAGVFAGILFPSAAALFRPLLAAAVIGTITIVLMRLDWRRLAAFATQPLLPVALLAWQLVVSPLLVWLATGALGLEANERVALLLQSSAPPIGSVAVFALILGLDGVLAMVGTVATTMLLPLTVTPIVGTLLPDAGIEIDLAAFFMRVTTLVCLPFLIAAIARRLLGAARLARNDEVLGGLNVVVLVIFALAVMDGVTARLLADPVLVVRLLLLSIAMAIVLHLSGWLLFRRAGVGPAYTAALVSGNRNMGLMLIITAGTAGEVFSLYVGVAQIPMYFAPLLLTPLVRLSQRRELLPAMKHTGPRP